LNMIVISIDKDK